MTKAQIGTEVVITKEGTHKFAVGEHVIISELDLGSSVQEYRAYRKGDETKNDLLGWIYDYEFEVEEKEEKLCRYEEFRERYNGLIEERHQLALKIEDLQEEREEINEYIEEIEFEWKKMLKY